MNADEEDRPKMMQKLLNDVNPRHCWETAETIRNLE
jgi:hypothetical protein